ncbi:hypothetical protein ACFLUE_00730 [Chloroflexota bacterium]
MRNGERRINEKFMTGAIKAFPGYQIEELFYFVPETTKRPFASGSRQLVKSL